MFRLHLSLYAFSETILEPPIIFDEKNQFENLDQKIHYWSNEIKQIQKKNKFFDYIDATKNTHRIIKDEFSTKNQTYHACKGDLFFIRTNVLRKGLVIVMLVTYCH